MDGRIYIAPLDGLTLTNDPTQDIWTLGAPSTKSIILHGFSLTSATTTDERIKLTLLRRSTAGSGGAGATEVPIEQGNTMTAEGSLVTLNTTQGTPGAILAGWQWSQQGEFLFLPTPKMQPVVSPSSFIALAVSTAVASSRTISGWVMWEEIG